MIVKCINNTGRILIDNKIKPHGIFPESIFGELDVGKEYLVMGMVLKDGILYYLVNGGRVISIIPNQLFEVVDNIIPDNWFFKSFTKDMIKIVNMEAIWGYYEFVEDIEHYTKLMLMDEEAHRLYFRRKIELEDKLNLNKTL